MIRDQGRQAYGAEVDGVEAREGGFPVWGEHGAVSEVVVAAREIEGGELEGEVGMCGGSGLEASYTVGYYFLANAIAGDDCDFEGSRERHD